MVAPSKPAPSPLRAGWPILGVFCCIWAFVGEARAQATTPGELVAGFESAPTRPLLAKPGHPQAYGGFSTGLALVQAEGVPREWSVPLGGGFGLGENVELGIDASFAISPFDPLGRLRLYGRGRLVSEHLAVQTGLWLPTQQGEIVGMELLFPARWVGERLHLYTQARGLFKPGATVLAGLSATGLAVLFPRVFLGLDVGGAKARVAGDAINLASAAAHLSYQLGEDNTIRARLAFPSLLVPDGPLDSRVSELVLVRRF
jgi:hypothetical protein